MTPKDPNPKLTAAILRRAEVDPSILSGNVHEITVRSRLNAVLAAKDIGAVFRMADDFIATGLSSIGDWKTLKDLIRKSDLLDKVDMKQLEAKVLDGIKAVHASARAGARSGDWQDRLIKSKDGSPKLVLANAITAFQFSPEWAGVLGFNEFNRTVVAMKDPPWEGGKAAKQWTDLYDAKATEWLHHVGILVPKAIAGDAIQTVSETNPFHPVRDYLDSLKWDKVKRVDQWAALYLGVNNTPITRAFGARWLISAVARIKSPGCKVDCCLILEGKQGKLKSSALKALGGEWFTDQISDLSTKDSKAETGGVWIMEFAELDTMSRAESSQIKSFMSRTTERYRPVYGHRVIETPRSCVFAGSCNEFSYLKDPTGARRFWPIKTGRIDLESLKRDRDQLWAEAVVMYDAGQPWWLDTDELEADATTEQAQRYEGDVWDEVVEEYLHLSVPDGGDVSVNEILTTVLNKKISDCSQQDRLRVGKILRHLNCEYFQTAKNIGRQRRFKKPEFELTAE